LTTIPTVAVVFAGTQFDAGATADLPATTTSSGATTTHDRSLDSAPCSASLTLTRGVSGSGPVVILVDGPLEGTHVNGEYQGRSLLLSEWQVCGRPLCHPHPISHYYTLDGHWLRSFSFLDRYDNVLLPDHAANWPEVFS